jgi:hypothetical protein
MPVAFFTAGEMMYNSIPERVLKEAPAVIL